MHKKQTDHGKNNRIVKNKMGEKFITKKKDEIGTSFPTILNLVSYLLVFILFTFLFYFTFLSFSNIFNLL